MLPQNLSAGIPQLLSSKVIISISIL